MLISLSSRPRSLRFRLETSFQAQNSLPIESNTSRLWEVRGIHCTRPESICSIDVRKNLDVVLLTFKHFYSKHLISTPLVIAGREILGSEGYVRKISLDPDLVENVAYFKAPSDKFRSQPFRRREALRLFFVGRRLWVACSRGPSAWSAGRCLQHNIHPRGCRKSHRLLRILGFCPLSPL